MAKKVYAVIYLIALVFLFGGVFTSCDKAEEMYNLNVKPNEGGGGHDTDIVLQITRDGENGKVTATKVVDGEKQDTTVIVPLGGVNFYISPKDTSHVSSAKVVNVSFSETGSKPESWEANGVFFTKTVKTYKHILNSYEKDITIDYLDAYTYVWGKRVEFPAANGSVSFDKEDIYVVDEGLDAEHHFYLSRTDYKVSFVAGNFNEKGYEVLAIKENDELLSVTKTNEGYETLSSTTARSWIEVTRKYKISGESVSRYEIILNNGITSPNYDVKVLGSFDLSKADAVLAQAQVSGVRNEANISITGYNQKYTVGNDKFTKDFVLFYEIPVWSDGTNNFTMPYRKYENINDKAFTMTDMTEVPGYKRKLNTHNISTTFNGNTASAKAETEIRVADVPEEDILKSRVVVDEGFSFINESTSKSWLKIKEEWSVSGTKEYEVYVNLMNGITAPSKVIKIVNSFTLYLKDAVLGKEVLTATETKGDFVVKSYERTYTVGNNVLDRVFTLRYQKATYSPLSNRDMPSKEYENMSDKNFTTSDMPNATSEGKEYQRKSYTHGISASFNGNNYDRNGEAELWLEIAGGGDLLSVEKTDEGYETLSSTTAKSWVEITKKYSNSGDVVSRYEIILNNGITAPTRDAKVLPSFSLTQKTAVLGTAAANGTRTDGYITATKYTQVYTVGNNQFTKDFTLFYELPQWSDGENTFVMPGRKYENVSDQGFLLSDMTPSAEYDRKLYTHSMSASFNGNSATAAAETEISVEKPKDDLVSRVILEEGLDYVNATTSKTWAKIKEVWSVSGEKQYEVSTNLINGITPQAKETKIITAFDLAQKTANLAGEKLVSTETKGDFVVRTYERIYTVGTDKFDRSFSLRYQKASYTPLNHSMQYREYQNVSDEGYALADLANTEQNNKLYSRKSYLHKMKAEFNGYPADSQSEMELWVEIEYPRETPHWLGKPVSAKYTRVQQSTGQKFMDMIYFEYENGCVLAPNGVVNLKLTYAFDPAIAAAQGVDSSHRDVYSAVYANGKWFPASITMTQGRWIYAGANHNGGTWSHTVHQNNAVTLGIGADPTPIPSAQSYTIEGNKITIKYAVNNGSTIANTSLSLR